MHLAKGRAQVVEPAILVTDQYSHRPVAVAKASPRPAPVSSPVSIFRTDSTPLITGKGQKHSAARIGDSDFESPAPLLCHVPTVVETLILSFLENR
jgi:hypothetical protein